MRIVGGTWRGRMLVAPPGQGTRPTADRIRQALFDMLMHAEWGGRAVIEDASVLDVFAGTGALGLEALSRGAASVCFIENDPAALKALRANIAACRAEDRVVVAAGDVLRGVVLPFVSPFDQIGLSGDLPLHLERNERMAPDNKHVPRTNGSSTGKDLPAPDSDQRRLVQSPPVMNAGSPGIDRIQAGTTWTARPFDRFAPARGQPAPEMGVTRLAMGRRRHSAYGKRLAPASLVFLDPPYGQNLIPRALDRLCHAGCIAPGALVVAETGRDETWVPGQGLLAERAHGAARMLVFRET